MKLNSKEKEAIKSYVESEWKRKPNHFPALSTLVYDILGNPTRERIQLINACMFENFKLMKEGK